MSSSFDASARERDTRDDGCELISFPRKKHFELMMMEISVKNQKTKKGIIIKN
jgi:hypothetical protein